jgi:hypothetical protein
MVCLLGLDGVEIGDDVLAGLFVEVGGSGEKLGAVAAGGLHQQRVAAAEHVSDDARSSDALGGVARIERQLRVSGTHVQDADCSGHCGVSFNRGRGAEART